MTDIDELIKMKADELKQLKKKKTEIEGSSDKKGKGLRSKEVVFSTTEPISRVAVCPLCGIPKRLDQEVSE